MSATPTTPPYRDPAKSADERTADLLARMTLEEKVAQMLCVWQKKPAMLVDELGQFDAAKARQHFGHGRGLGQVGRPSDAGGGLTARQMAELTNAIQRFFVEESRLGIPVIFHEECLHGHAAKEGTSFPQPIGLGATFDPDFIERLYAMTAAEARARGTHQALTPVVDVAREPRWGRVEETFGEDPYLVARLGVAAVRGFQGDATFRDKRHVIATLKHYAAHGQPESGTNCAPVNVSMRVLREVFLSTFKAAILEGGALSVMPSYNEIDGVPSHANRWLLEDVLRGEWGFRGFTVSDYFAIRELDETATNATSHYVARDGRDAAELAVRAGVDIELPDLDCYPHLVELVREGVIPESLIDERLRPMLRAKFLLGLFEDPYVDPAEAERLVREPAHRSWRSRPRTRRSRCSRTTAACCRSTRARPRIAVIGPNADRLMLGGYSGVPLHATRCCRASARACPPRSRCSTTRAARSRLAAPGSRTRSRPPTPRRTAAAFARPLPWLRRPTSSFSPSGTTSRRRARPGRSTTSATGRAWTWSVSRTSWSRPSRPRASPSLRCSSADVRPRFATSSRRPRRFSSVVSRAGDRAGGGRGPVRRREARRQAAHHATAFGRPRARLLQLQALRAARVSVRLGGPLFAFGFGLSYTTFTLSNLRLEQSIDVGDIARLSWTSPTPARVAATRWCSSTSATASAA